VWLRNDTKELDELSRMTYATGYQIWNIKCYEPLYMRCIEGSSKRTDQSEDLGVDGRIILEWILGK
jgi:hypothetical protein